MVVVAAVEIDEFEKDVVVADDNLQNTNHVAVEKQTSSCLMLWWRSDYHVETCLPNEMRSELSVRLDYSIVGYVKNVDETSVNDDSFGSKKLQMRMEVETTLHYDLFLSSDDHC